MTSSCGTGKHIFSRAIRWTKLSQGSRGSWPREANVNYDEIVKKKKKARMYNL